MTLEMNPEIRARWTAALRSGDYQQGREALREETDDGEKLCCLGVLCVLAEQDGVITPTRSPDEDNGPLWAYDGRPDYLPESVKDWAGLTDCNPLVRTGDSIERTPLAWLNDDRSWSFARIADAIDGGTP